jgi:hypothetical protein
MATIRAVIVDPDGTVRDTEIGSDLASFQAVVGGYIEGVLGNVATMYVNEEGLLRALPPNPLATQFAQFILGRNVVLVGTALILGPPDDVGNDTPVRQTVVDYFNQED